MGFKQAKMNAVKALRSGEYQCDSRGSIDVKNKLFTGDVSAEFVAGIIERSRGQDHECRKHHSYEIDVHIIKKDNWYVKFYFIDPDTFFISVHEQNL